MIRIVTAKRYRQLEHFERAYHRTGEAHRWLSEFRLMLDPMFQFILRGLSYPDVMREDVRRGAERLRNAENVNAEGEK